MKLIDLTGKRFGKLTVKKRVEVDRKGTFWECKCDCGNVKVVIGNHLKSGNTKSCGCLAKKNGTTHGAGNEPWYGSWMGMVRRMTNPKEHAYNHYVVEKGLHIDPSFVSDPWAFYEEIGEYPGKGYSIERIDNDLGYIKGNLKWATPLEQASNKGIYKNNRSGFSGITWSKERSAWDVRIYHNKKTYFVGRFSDLEEAVKEQKNRKVELTQEKK